MPLLRGQLIHAQRCPTLNTGVHWRVRRTGGDGLPSRRFSEGWRSALHSQPPWGLRRPRGKLGTLSNGRPGSRCLNQAAHSLPLNRKTVLKISSIRLLTHTRTLILPWVGSEPSGTARPSMRRGVPAVLRA